MHEEEPAAAAVPPPQVVQFALSEREKVPPSQVSHRDAAVSDFLPASHIGELRVRARVRVRIRGDDGEGCERVRGEG